MGVLRASMTEMGMIDPILVMPRAAASGNLKYEVLDGQRRVLVARALGWERVRCLVVPPEGLAIEAIRLHQNQAHAKMTAWEESVYYTRLCDRLDLNFEELCVAVRQSAEYVSDRLLLQRAELETQAALQNGLITLAIARELRRLKNRQWELYYLDQCLRSGTGSKILHGWITDHLRRGGLVQQTVSDQPPIVTATPPPPAELLCGFCGKPSGGRQLMNVWVHTDEYGTVSRMLGEMLARVEAETQPAPPDNKVTG
jgi:ParB/RepB/Spo0J family partition protein